MAKKWPGGIITKNQATPTGPSQTGVAPGVWTIPQMDYWVQQGLWPVAGTAFWINSLGAAANYEWYYGVAIDSTKNIYCFGADNTTGGDMLFTKYNSAGVNQWQKTLGAASGQFIGYGIAIDSSDNIYVCGVSSANKGLLLKYDTSGTLQWQREFPLTSGFYRLAIDSSGNIFPTGLYTTATPRTVGLTVKFNSSGTLQTIQKVLSSGTASVQRLEDIAFDSSGNFYVCGRTDISNTAGNYDCYLVKYDSTGTAQFQVGYSASTSVITESYYGIAIDSSDNIYCAGAVHNGTVFVGSLVKYNTSGVIQWQKSLSGSLQMQFRGVATDSSGNIYCVGNYSNTDFGVIVKYSSSGVLQWQRSLAKTSSSIDLRAIKVDNAGNMYISGIETITASTYANGLLLKLPSNGTLTGTYGSYTYAVSSYTDNTPSYTASTKSAIDTNLTQTATTSTYTAGTAAYTSTTTTL